MNVGDREDVARMVASRGGHPVAGGGFRQSGKALVWSSILNRGGSAVDEVVRRIDADLSREPVHMRAQWFIQGPAGLPDHLRLRE
jgi:hypothetical protein